MSPNSDLMQPDPACPAPPVDAKGDPIIKQEGPRLPSLVQGPDFSKPPTPTFKDANGCHYSYVSPNSDLMQPDPTCAKGKPEQSTHAPKK